jgi:prepilin-type N-terminal cleavage/methylation domain-containing protein
MQTGAASRLAPGKVRPAFSLVELMVVTVIVVILAGLVAGVVVKAVDASRTTATLTTMEIIKSGLSKQLQEIGEQSRKAGKSTTDIYKDIRAAFPSSLDAVGLPEPPVMIDGSPVTVQSLAPYIRQKSTFSTATYGTLGNDEKASILLRMILEKGPKTKVEVDQLPKGALGQIKGIDAVLDSWAEPIGVSISINPTNLKPTIQLTSRNATMKN